MDNRELPDRVPVLKDGKCTHLTADNKPTWRPARSLKVKGPKGEHIQAFYCLCKAMDYYLIEAKMNPQTEETYIKQRKVRVENTEE